MIAVCTESTAYAEQLLPEQAVRWVSAASFPSPALERLVESLYGGKALRCSTLESELLWKYLFIVDSAPRSQYDTLIELCRGRSELPQGVLCVAASGQEFHGYKGRPWVTLEGNIHLSVHFAPESRVEKLGIGFLVLAAVSVIEALDGIPGLEQRAEIKWANEILIDNAKVCGILAYAQTVGDTVTDAVLGIGLNVEAHPPVEPTPFVPEVAALRHLLSEPACCGQRLVFSELIQALDRNYRLLLDGGYRILLDRYRRRSSVIGREVIICSEESDRELDVIASGRVAGFNDNLGLCLEGSDEPFSMGRLALNVSEENR